MTASDDRSNVGAFGLRIEGFDDPALLANVPSTWPPIEVHTLAGNYGGDAPVFIDDETASIGMHGIGEIRVQRDPATLLVRSRHPVDGDRMVHPVLGWAAWVMACWNGRSVVHGAAFVGGDGAWVALGKRGEGKSTLMAALAQRGIAVLTDDVTVIDNGVVLAGPRRIDLRPDAPESLGMEPTGWIRGETRAGVSLAPVESSVPLAGFVRLRWAEEVSVVPIPPFDRIGAFDGLVGSLASAPPMLLDAVSVPMIELSRPRSWATIEAGVDAIVVAATA